MDSRQHYFPPQIAFSELAPSELVCDSYDSGIDDYDYEEIDWSA